MANSIFPNYLFELNPNLEWILIILFHLVILAPLFLYVGVYKQFNIDNSNDNSITNILFCTNRKTKRVL